MKYTNKNYFLETKLVEKLDLMVVRVVKHLFDLLIIFDGKEGLGKTTLASATGYYLAHKSGRSFTMDNVFFDIDEMTEFAIKNEKQVILWDECALGALSMEHYNRNQIKLLKLLMVARKKGHMYLFCIPRINKLREAIVERALALIHVYSRDGTSRGRFTYYKEKGLEQLYAAFKRTRVMVYRKYFSFSGSFSNTLSLILDEKEYDRRKDAAILSIGDDGSEENVLTKNLREEVIDLRFLLATIPNVTQRILAKHCRRDTRTLRRWKERKTVKNQENSVDEGLGATIIIKGDTQSNDGEGITTT